MFEFNPNQPGKLYQLNYSTRPIDSETGTRRGSSGGMVNHSYFIVEQIVHHEPSVVLPKPLTGFRVRSLNPHNYRVATAIKPEQYTLVGVLKPEVKIMNIETDLGGFVQAIADFSGLDRLLWKIHTLSNEKGNDALKIIEKLYQDLRVKSGLMLIE